MGKKNGILTWKGFHRWVGVAMTVFMLLFCLSGIILNHRDLFAGCSVGRGWLPSSYHVRDYNNGVLKGSAPYGRNGVLVYGNSGIWLTDPAGKEYSDFNRGLPDGIDGRNIRNVVKTKDGRYWCGAQFGLYKLDGDEWRQVDLPGNKERLSDIALSADSSRVVVLTRSHVYIYDCGKFIRRTLGAPAGYKPEVTLFKTIWQLHSGELFGLGGRIAVDLIACVLVFLCVTGLVLFVLPYSIRRSATANLTQKARWLKWNFRWHNKIGYVTAILTILIVVTGMCLRPPLMIPFVMIKTAPVPGSAMASENVWHDRLRGIRWDDGRGMWLISTSEGWLHADESFDTPPVVVDSKGTPPVSPMGVTVFRCAGADEWIIGSFSGIYFWNSAKGVVTEYPGGEPVEGIRRGRPVSNRLISGFTDDFCGKEIAVDYASGSTELPPMPEVLSKQPMSLWNFALELHVGRCYTPFLGPLSELFVFLSGLILTLVLVSGLIIHNRIKRKQRINN